MANRPEVRDALRERGIEIPADTWFIGGYHDTCSDDVELYDLDALPATHQADLERIRESLDKARARNAQERARRFESCPPHASPAAALRHVEERSEHLAEPRPEYGHCTNAVCVVGRRSLTRGLFLDRRAFLVSYDADQDPDDQSLAALMAAVVPVCAGISLEYYFSFVDNDRYGCGTKLPHNVTGLVGVMDGHASDLRTGLPWQMVEIHEPVRILFVIETTPERLMKVIDASPSLETSWWRIAGFVSRPSIPHRAACMSAGTAVLRSSAERRGTSAGGAFLRRMVCRQNRTSPHGLDSNFQAGGPIDEWTFRKPSLVVRGVGARRGVRRIWRCCGCWAGLPSERVVSRITGATFSAAHFRARGAGLETRRRWTPSVSGDFRQLVCGA